MATIAQLPLFSWENVDASPEILRLRRVLDALPDGQIIDRLIAERKGKRNDYPIQAVWNSLLAGIVFGHPGVESLRRELARNAELRQVCGFDPLLGEKAVPPKWVYSRMVGKLYKHRDLIDKMFHELVERLSVLLEDFGRDLAIDGKAISTWGRKDADAGWGAKTSHSPKGEAKKNWWFGYKLHLVVDANYELPLGYRVTNASAAETTELMPMVEELAERHPTVTARARSMSADRGYDDGADKAALYDEHHMIPLMDTRNLNKDENGKPLWEALDPAHHDTVYYDGTGRMACKVDPMAADDEKAFAPMQFMGYEKERRTLKFRCPAAAYGIECRNRAACRCRAAVRDGAFGRVVRVPLERDRRIFLPAHRHSRGFREGYKKRSSVERVNSRIDQVYGFERHFIRGQKKMELRVGLALAVMLATAAAWIEADRPELARSLLRTG